MTCAHHYRLLLLAALLAAPGCRVFRPDVPSLADKSPLKPLLADPGHTQLDVCFVRFPSGDAEGISELWQEVDEQSLPAADRKRMARSGFRAGVIDSRLPVQVREALAHAAPPSGPGQTPTPEPDGEVGVTRHQVYLHAAQRGELVASGVLSQFHVLEIKDGRPQGQTFDDGQAQFAITAERLGDGRVRLELTPEIHYGPFRQQFAPGEGSFRFDNSRKKKVLTDLKLQATLSPGQMLLIAGRPEQPGSLGDRFFRETDGAAPRPRLLLLRLSPPAGDLAFQNPPAAHDE
jgi:hypothetical protein